MPRIFWDEILIGLVVGVLGPAVIAVLLVMMTRRARSSQVIWFTAPAYVALMLLDFLFLAITMPDRPGPREWP